MNPNFLEFEQPIAELEAKIQELRHASQGQAFNIEEDIGRLKDKLKHKTAEIFRNLTPWQIAQLARHPARPYTLDYLQTIGSEFHELGGEGGSGGALAIGVGDRTIMLQYSTYSVITPEGCASILWKSTEKAKDAADALAITAPRLLELGLVDKIVREPLGGAHRDPRAMAIRLKAVLLNQLDALERSDTAGLVEQRYRRLR